MKVSLENMTNDLKNIIMSLKKCGLSGGEVSEHLFDNFGMGLHPNAINRFYRLNKF